MAGNVLELLSKHGVPHETWGTGDSKTLKHLESEVEGGETELVVIDGKLIRKTAIIFVEVLADVDGRCMRLFEAKQVFVDGRERIRGHEFDAGVVEKLKKDEAADEKAVLRALTEELGIKKFAKCDKVLVKHSDEPSKSYPGLMGSFDITVYRVVIERVDFKPEYIEVQEDKSTFFRWNEVSAECAVCKRHIPLDPMNGLGIKKHRPKRANKVFSKSSVNEMKSHWCGQEPKK